MALDGVQFTRRALALGVAASACGLTVAAADRPLDRSLTVALAGDPLTLRSDRRFAGVISSLQFRGMEYVNAADHGRLLQSAVQFDGLGECLNPTQAGSSTDRERSSSHLLSFHAAGGLWETTTQAAWWNRRSADVCTTPEGVRRRPAGGGRLSDVLITHRHRFGASFAPTAAESEVIVTLGSPRDGIIVEALTLYAPPAFATFHAWRDGLLTLDDDLANPGERFEPRILSTADGAHAFGFLSRAGPAGYGRWRFDDCSKLNIVYRLRGPRPARHLYFNLAWAIGTRAEVARAFSAILGAALQGQGRPTPRR